MTAADAPDMRAEDRKDKLALVHKALICLGDIERYKEQYSDAARRGEEKAEAERFVRARGYYDAARAVIPKEGKLGERIT